MGVRGTPRDLDWVVARGVVLLIAALLLRWLTGCLAPATEVVQAEPALAMTPAWVHVPLASVTVEPPRADLDVPDRCDPLLVVDTPSGRQLSKQLPAWLANERARAKRQAELRRRIAIVADELGADPLAAEVLWRKAILESSGNAGSVHVLSADLDANRRAARRGRASSSERWASVTVPVYERRRGGQLEAIGDRGAWSIGRGLYGMVTGLHLIRWSDDAPPWSLCDAEVATVTAIWSMRAGLKECRGRTLRDAYRRFSSGRCAVREPERERSFDRLAGGRVRGLKLGRIDPDARADFGDRWPEESADRGLLLAQLRRRIADEVEAL